MKLQTTSYKLKAKEATHGHARFRVRAGFTLVEIMVAVSLFAVVAVITTGALVTASNVNRKAQAIKVAIDNLNFAIDSMVLNLQSGELYHCIQNANSITGWDSTYSYSGACSAINPYGDGIAFDLACPAVGGVRDCERMIYKRRVDSTTNNGSIQVWSDTNSSFTDITSQEINIETFKIYIEPTFKNRALLVIRGNVAGNPDTIFNIENTIYAQH